MRKESSVLYFTDYFLFMYNRKTYKLHKSNTDGAVVYNPETCRKDWFPLTKRVKTVTPKNINSARKMYNELLKQGWEEVSL